MRAAVCYGFGQSLVIEDLALREVDDHEVHIQIKACAVCHSDVSFIEGAWGGDLPAVFGHEAAGIIINKGSKVTEYETGDHVIVTLIKACGSCIS